MGFQHLSSQEVKKAASKGGSRKRSPELAKAWGDAAKIRKMYRAGKSPGEIASDYQINVRAVYRIARGK